MRVAGSGAVPRTGGRSRTLSGRACVAAMSGCGVIDGPDQDDPAMNTERINRTAVDENFIIALSPCGTACHHAARVIHTCLFECGCKRRSNAARVSDYWAG